jgi:putative membrane protein
LSSNESLATPSAITPIVSRVADRTPANQALARPVAAGTFVETDELNDAQIAALADTANIGEIEQGRYAVLHASDARVRKFAQHMMSAHGAIGQKMACVLHDESIVPSPSTQSAQLGADARQTLQTLGSKVGSAFDKAYIEAQVKEHQDVLDMFDNELIPNARDLQLKVSLQEVRPMVAEYLGDARDIQKALGSR